MSSADTLDFVLAELRSGNPAQALVVANNLKQISVALGSKKFLQQLLPEIKLQVTDNAHPDEVAARLATVLGELVDFVADSTDGAPQLLPPLKVLCEYDETAVREAAVASINNICKSKVMTSKLCQDHLMPIIVDGAGGEAGGAAKTGPLADNKDWWAPRVSACGLVATAYAAWDQDTPEHAEKRKKLVETFKSLCLEEMQQNPMVKSAAAARIGDMVDAMAKYAKKAGLTADDAYLSDVGKHGANLSEVYCKLLSDDLDYVKVAAVRSSPAIFSYWPLDSKVGEKFRECAADKSWRVRVAVAEVLADVAGTAKQQPAREADVARSICSTLMVDPEAEVKHAIGERSAAVAQKLGEAFSEAEIFPALRTLVLTLECNVREKLAGVLMDMAAPLGRDRATALILNEGLFAQLCNDENINVRLAVLNKLRGPFLDVVRASGPHQADLFETLRPLAGNAQWRVRHAVLLLVPKLAAVLKADEPDAYEAKVNATFGFKLFFNNENTEEGEKAMQAKYGNNANNGPLQVLPWALDPIAQIRLDYVGACAKIAHVVSGGKQGQDSPGSTWVLEKILPVLVYCCTQKEFKDKYHQRVVLLHGLVALAPMLPQAELEAKLGTVFAMAKETLENGNYVPSLRLMIARDVGKTAPFVSKKCRDGDLIPALQELEKDEDIDVSSFAKDSLNNIAD